MASQKRYGASEQAPLLASGQESDDDDDETIEGNRPTQDIAFLEKAKFWLAKTGKWLWANAMIVAIVMLVIAGIVVLAVYFAVLYDPAPPAEKGSPVVCLTPSCVLASSRILSDMSPRYQKIDPCHEFDKFVCQGFDGNHDLRPDQQSLSTGTLMTETNQQILRHVLESPYSAQGQEVEIDTNSKREIFDKLKDSYDACMDLDQIQKIGSAPLIGVLRNIDDLFPASRPTDATRFKNKENEQFIPFDREIALSRTIAYLIKIGATALVEFGVGADDKDPDTVVPFMTPLRQPGLPSKEYYKDPSTVAHYSQVIGRVLEALLREARSGSVPNDFQFLSNELVEEIVTFESKIAQATPDTADLEDATKYYNSYTLDEARSLVPQLSIPYIFAKRAPSDYQPEKLIVTAPGYLRTLSEVLNQTSTEALQAYFCWKAVQTYADKVADEALIPLKQFNNVLLGKDADALGERWRTCVKATDHQLGWILTKFFVEKAFSEEAKHFGDRIVSEIKLQFRRTLGKADWMSRNVRELAIQKVENIVQKIGYPIINPDIRDSSALQDYYMSLNISSTGYFENALEAAKWKTKKTWSALGKPTDRDQWELTADTVNAYYNPSGNEIVFPAGIMQAPLFYDPSLPSYLAWGGFGSAGGHELSHAFDSAGRHYDERGNFTDWWDTETIDAFEQRAQCFIDQYDEFSVSTSNGSSINVNGKLTLGENIADSGGLNAAFAAWKRSEAKDPGQLLPGLQNFTKEQIFFISYANAWCGKIRPEFALDAIYRDPHPPSFTRILGPVANSRDFRKSFDCPVREPTCELW